MAHCKGNVSPAAAEIEMFSSSKLTFPSTELFFFFFFFLPSYWLMYENTSLMHTHSLSVTEQNGHFLLFLSLHFILNPVQMDPFSLWCICINSKLNN